jgi:DNA-binding NarL/FixJ family response regulator
MSIRVMLCDDHAMLRAGLRALLSSEPGMQVVGEAADGLEAVERVLALRPDVAVVDISTPGQEVLRLLACGYTNHEIADQLVISVKTVETHRAHVLGKLGLRKRAELVRYAQTHGLLAGV